MSTATLAGSRVLTCVVDIPERGIWTADVETDDETAITGQATLVLSDLTLVGTVVSGGTWQGRGQYHLVGGKGGWGAVIPKLSYHNDAGIKVQNILEDAARACGETFSGTTAERLGAYWVREASVASLVLWQLATSGWYVDEAGLTKLGTRPVSQYSGAGTIAKKSASDSVVDIAADTIADLLPGVVVEGIQAKGVRHELSCSKLRTRIYGEAVRDTWRSIVLGSLPDYKFRGTYEYRVVSQQNDRLNLQCTSSALGMPDLQRVRYCPGLQGAKTSWLPGATVLVTFVNGDPSRPIILGGTDPESPGATPNEVVLRAGATGALPWEHVTSAEALVTMLDSLLAGIAIAVPGALTGAGLAAAKTVAINSALGLMATSPITPYATALAAALAAKTASTTVPNVGFPHVKGA
jgi:hypothetical protein